ncbi:MAG: succinate dehydrogenase, cytochrome b556 subunit [Pseudooceanicola sp.]|nr:succinate dehydrogenase, cytochrome b556 subunit [Pseudooceanicola sp.]|tara:strand:- start:21384 stop:21773 length:390 start_codon:yes stop_codon:yes gene_type:complete
MADVNRGNRPLSPFMLGQYYRPQLNSVTSILTRISGNALIVGAILIAWWLLAASSGVGYFDVVDYMITSWVGDIVMFFSLLGLWFHSLAGCRHLLWDNGFALDMETSDKLGWGIIGLSIVLTILTALIV